MPGPIKANQDLPRGDTWVFQDLALVFVGGWDLYASGVIVRSTFKAYLDLEDPTHLDPLVDAANNMGQVDNAARGGVTILSARGLRVVFPPSITELVTASWVHWDIVVDRSYNRSDLLYYGEHRIFGDVTRTRP